MSNETKIHSIRQTLAGGYRKPEPETVQKYRESLYRVPRALDYLRLERGLTKDTIEYFKLGFDDQRNAISIPVYKDGELVNIRYRLLADNATAKYSQERGCEVWLYHDKGVENAKKKGNLLIVEGEFDLMSAWQAGYKAIVSPASGKDSYGPWIELLDTVPKVYIAYDNDEAGKKSSMAMAERVGIDKSFEVSYPEGIKDANEFFLQKTPKDFLQLVNKAEPYYKHKFSGVGDIIDSMMERPEQRLELDMVPYIKWKTDWVAVLSADSGFGKTTYALNIVDELAHKDVPTLVLPFERGIKEVGERYLQVRYNKQEEDLLILSDTEWEEMKVDAAPLPLYFSMPSTKDFEDTVRRAKRIFDIKFIVIDHLDYFIRGDNKVSKQADFMHELKELCIEIGVCAIVVHHINKPEGGKRRNRIYKEDMKGSSDIYQIAEAVILMYEDRDTQLVVVDVAKNKGKQGSAFFDVNMATGRFRKVDGISPQEMQRLKEQADQAWENE